MATPPPPNLTLWSILTESKRIINAHSRHFLALSVIFLLPLSFFLIVSPTLLHLLTPSNSSHIHISLRQAQTTTTTSNLPFQFSFPLLLFSLFLLIFSLCSLATITHSVFHGFFGRPVKLLSTVTSLYYSFLPLLATVIVSNLILFPLPLLLYFLGAATSVSSFTFLATSFFILIALLYIRISWTLASVIAVVESSWGLEPLRRSASLMKGMKFIGASSFCFFNFLEGIILWSGSLYTVASDIEGVWSNWDFVLQIVATSTILMLLLLYNTAVNTVLYMYCKAVNGELALEIAEEFRWQYVSLPFDDGKVPHVVSVVNV